MPSIEQAAANLAAALVSGNAQDSESALASYAEAIDGVEDVPAADNGPIKHDLNSDEGLDLSEPEDAVIPEPLDDEMVAPAESEGLAAVEDDA